MRDGTGLLHGVRTLVEGHGPGLRYVAFLQGCPLACESCAWPQLRPRTGRVVQAAALVRQASRYRPYFAQTGGLTLAGAEPLAQVEFCHEVAKAARQLGISLCLETTGYRWDPQVRALYQAVDLVLLYLPRMREEAPARWMGRPMDGLYRALEFFRKNRTLLWIRWMGTAAPETGVDLSAPLLDGLCLERVEEVLGPHGRPASRD